MALDGAFLNTIANELRETVINSRVEKIMQPSKEEIIFSLRYKGGSKKLLFSANANSPRINFTKIPLENPKQPPMFCMLLRKHIGTGKLIDVRQNGMDRILFLDFETVNELGDLTVITIIIEIMGRHSNIIMVNAEGKILDSIKRITNEISSVRMILPGMRYQLPPSQDKLNVLENSIDEIMNRFDSISTTDVAKAIMGTLEGISPILAREIALNALKGQDIEKDKLSSFYKDRIKAEFLTLKENLVENKKDLTVVIDDTKKIRDFTVIDIKQYGANIQKLKYESPSELLDVFYADKDQVARMKQRSHDLLKLLVSSTERTSKKINIQKEELKECENREQYKIYGDLINSHLYIINKGDSFIEVGNFYEEGCPLIKIKLDKRLNPAQNAQKYYQEYRKLATAETMLKELIKKAENELIYLDSVFDAVSRTQGESELLEIREELAEQGYIRSVKSKGKMLKAQPPIKYRSTDGFSILCGRNNKQNDKLTMKIAKNYDMWLHTQGIAGSHVIIESDGKEISDNAITQAAIIAAYNSNGRYSAQVAVDYTLVRYVKKPSGAKPGMVIFTDYYTAYVTPDQELVESLLVK